MFLLHKSTLFLTTLLTVFFCQLPANPHTHNRLQSDESTGKEKMLFSGVIEFEPPPNNGDPNATAAGGTRTGCPNQKVKQKHSPSNLTALVPKTTKQWITVKEHPSFFVYLPPTSGSAIFFQLKDSNDQVVYQNLLPVQSDRGKIVELEIPKNSPALEVNQNYQWYVILLCKYDPQIHQNDVASFDRYYDFMNEPWIIGAVKRVELSPFNSKSDRDISLDLASQYAKNGLWFETLTVLNDLIKEQPDNKELIRAWQELLRSQGIQQDITKVVGM